MQRNLDRRVESTFPILDKEIKQFIIKQILNVYLSDNQKARKLLSNGDYQRVKPAEKGNLISVQEYFMENKFLPKP